MKQDKIALARTIKIKIVLGTGSESGIWAEIECSHRTGEHEHCWASVSWEGGGVLTAVEEAYDLGWRPGEYGWQALCPNHVPGS